MDRGRVNIISRRNYGDVPDMSSRRKNRTGEADRGGTLGEDAEILVTVPWGYTVGCGGVGICYWIGLDLPP